MTVSINHDIDRNTGSASLHLHSDYSELTRLSRWIAALGEEWLLSSRDLYRLELAVTELVTNIIDHGTLDADAPGIHITINLRERDGRSQLSVLLVDSSAPFNPLDADVPRRPDALENAQIGGLGIHLAKHACDSYRYEYADGKNLFTMLFEDVTHR